MKPLTLEVVKHDHWVLISCGGRKVMGCSLFEWCKRWPLFSPGICALAFLLHHTLIGKKNRATTIVKCIQANLQYFSHNPQKWTKQFATHPFLCLVCKFGVWPQQLLSCLVLIGSNVKHLFQGHNLWSHKSATFRSLAWQLRALARFHWKQFATWL